MFDSSYVWFEYHLLHMLLNPCITDKSFFLFQFWCQIVYYSFQDKMPLISNFFDCIENSWQTEKQSK